MNMVKIMKKHIVTCLLVFLSTVLPAAEFNKFFSSYMVLQRDVPVRIYGEDTSGEKVKVSFSGQSVETVAKNGKWEVLLEAMPADAEGKSLILQSGGKKHELKDILVGDVWVLGGQSNMYRGFRAYPKLAEVPKKANHPFIRIVGIDPDIKKTSEPVDHFEFRYGIAWKRAVYEDDEQTAKILDNFSPAGYYFGEKLQKHIQAPVGLVMACLGATKAECWTPREVIAKDPRLHFHFEADRDIKPDNETPHRSHTSWLYNGVVHPITKFTIKGVLWYQGESNARTAEPYRILLPHMIVAWRAAWGQGDFPFLFAQLASYGNVKWDSTGTAWALLRESQTYGLSLPNTGMITLLDAGEFEDIHPQNKDIVGERFLMKARDVAYGQDVISSGPVYDSMTVDGSSVVVTFKNVGQGLECRKVSMPENKTSTPETKNDPKPMLSSRDGKVEGFVLCGADENFMEAEAEIINENQVILRSDVIKEPKQVRYGWENFTLANVYNKEGFPAEPFRTDSFK